MILVAIVVLIVVVLVSICKYIITSILYTYTLLVCTSATNTFAYIYRNTIHMYYIQMTFALVPLYGARITHTTN